MGEGSLHPHPKGWGIRDPPRSLCINDKILAEDFLKKWYYWATHSQIEPIINVAKTIKSHWTGVINYAETKISNGVLEGINSMVQSAKSSARGFRTTKNLILIIYLRLGKLQFNLPT